MDMWYDSIFVKTFLLMFLPVLLSLKIYMEWWWRCSMSDCFVTPWTVAHQAPLSMGISQTRILEWVAISFSRGIFRTQGSNPGLPHCRKTLYHLSHQGSPVQSWGHKEADTI